ncbi:MAG: phosphonate C-P lyase system protein PhnG [Rhodomicrobium sp.]
MLCEVLPRSQWIRALCAADERRILDLAERLSRDLDAQPTSNPCAGLQLLRLRESVTLDTFYIGEVAVTSASVQLRTPGGNRVEGGAIVMDDRIELASALAVLDGVLAFKLPGAKEADRLLQEGHAALGQKDRIRAAMLSRTKAGFSSMAEAGND